MSFLLNVLVVINNKILFLGYVEKDCSTKEEEKRIIVPIAEKTYRNLQKEALPSNASILDRGTGKTTIVKFLEKKS